MVIQRYNRTQNRDLPRTKPSVCLNNDHKWIQMGPVNHPIVGLCHWFMPWVLLFTTLKAKTLNNMRDDRHPNINPLHQTVPPRAPEGPQRLGSFGGVVHLARGKFLIFPSMK